jgi:hypothetical protein
MAIEEVIKECPHLMRVRNYTINYLLEISCIFLYNMYRGNTLNVFLAINLDATLNSNNKLCKNVKGDRNDDL